jgi:hypothetical protein
MGFIKKRALGNTIQVSLVIILALICIVILTAAFQHFVTSRNAFGIDFYVYWLGGKALFLDGQSPYSDEITRQAQLGILDRLAKPYENQHMYLNPPYGLIPYFPSFWLEYSWAYAFYLALNFVLLAFALRFAFPSTPTWILATVFIFYPVARGLIMGQLSLTIGILFLIVHGILTGKQRRSDILIFIAGFLLAWLTNKPQLTWLLVGFYLLYALQSRLWAAVFGFAGGLALFGILSWIWVPFWPVEMLSTGLVQAANVRAKAWVFFAADWFLPAPWSWIIGAAALIIVVSITVVIFLKWWRGESGYLLMLIWVVVLSFFLNPMTLPPEQVIFLLPLLVWVSDRSVYMKKWFIPIWIFALMFPWIQFFLTLGPAESYALSVWPPILFVLWSVGVLSQEVFRARTSQSL